MTRGFTTRPSGNRRGFTLLETSMALVIIGVGVLAFVEAQNAFVKNNMWSSQAATATLLAGEVRELSRRLPRHDPVTGLYIESTAQGDVLHGWGAESGEVTPEDFDDIDDLDGLKFGGDGDFDGPIDAKGEIVPSVDANGNPMVDQDDNPIPMAGWSQSVYVDKLDPFNYATVREHAFKENANGDFPGRRVDQYPLRVTVVVEFQGPNDVQPVELARVSWIVP